MFISSKMLMTATEIEIMTAMEILLHQIVSDQSTLMKHLHEVTSNTSTNHNGNLNSKMNEVSNSIFQLKDLIDQSQKLLHNFQNNVNVALNPEPTVFNLDVQKN